MPDFLLNKARAPYWYSSLTTSSLFKTHIYALILPLIWGIVLYGIFALLILCVSVIAVFLADFVSVRFRSAQSIPLHTLLVSLLITAISPPGLPLILLFVVAFTAVFVPKYFIGSLNFSVFHPAIIFIVIIAAFFPHMYESSWMVPHFWTNSATSPADHVLFRQLALSEWLFSYQSPHAVVNFLSQSLNNSFLQEIGIVIPPIVVGEFLGMSPSAIGTGSTLLLLLASLFLFSRRTLSLSSLVSFFLVFASGIFIFAGLPEGEGLFSGNVLVHFFYGGTIFAMFFFVADVMTTPLSRGASILYGTLTALLATLLRLLSFGAADVFVALLFSYAFVPLIDHINSSLLFKRRRQRQNFFKFK